MGKKFKFKVGQVVEGKRNRVRLILDRSKRGDKNFYKVRDFDETYSEDDDDYEEIPDHWIKEGDLKRFLYKQF